MEKKTMLVTRLQDAVKELRDRLESQAIQTKRQTRAHQQSEEKHAMDLRDLTAEYLSKIQSEKNTRERQKVELIKREKKEKRERALAVSEMKKQRNALLDERAMAAPRRCPSPRL